MPTPDLLQNIFFRATPGWLSDGLAPCDSRGHEFASQNSGRGFDRALVAQEISARGPRLGMSPFSKRLTSQRDGTNSGGRTTPPKKNSKTREEGPAQDIAETKTTMPMLSQVVGKYLQKVT
jgi:hypothetical protein